MRVNHREPCRAYRVRCAPIGRVVRDWNNDMHFELPRVRIHSLKDFIKHYLMIVLSILTALGLEAWIEHVHHAHAAEEASRQMTAELRHNLAETRESLQKNEATLQLVGKLDATLIADLKDGLPPAVINQHIRAQEHGFQLNLNWPGLPSSAWDVAVANQSVSWVEPANLKKFSTAYAAQRETDAWVQHDSVLMLDVPRVINFRTDLDLGRDVDPQAFLYTVQQMKVTITSMKNNLQELEKHLADAVPDETQGSR
ncbi:hypothetical protein B0E51_00180 [Rhodanobacter sp. C05]|nr:hypothetical protein B0E51_00180 [Rhodanobacter sp. C05]